MKDKIHYETKQRAQIIKALQDLQGKDITIKDLQEYFKTNKIKIGQATLYRNLENLAHEKIVRKYSLANEKSARFQYLNNISDCDNHLHFKCEKCGKLLHVHCDIFLKAQKHLAKEHGFDINHLNTVIYGKCKSCVNIDHQNTSFISTCNHK